MSLSSNEVLLVREDSIYRYNAKRDLFCRDVNMKTYYERILEEQDLSLDAQFERMCSIDGKIAKITVNGGMSEQGPDWVDVYLGYGGTSYANIRRGIDESIEAGVERIDITMNTQGGAIDHLEITSDKIKEAVSLGIQVDVYNSGMIASAGVYLAAPASNIYSLGKTSQIGSIGVVVEGYDFSEYYKKMGIESIVITNTDSPDKRLDLTSDSGKAILREELDDIAEIFFEHVASERNINIEAIKELKGRMVISTTAESIGLMDKAATTDLNGGGSKNKKNLKSNTEKKMTDEELATVGKTVADAVTAAVAPVQKELTELKNGIVADKAEANIEAKRKESFSALKGKYSEQSAMIDEEMKKGAECSAEFVLSVVDAESARTAENDNNNVNEGEKHEGVEATTPTGSKDANRLSGVKKALGGK